jgi:hypothetical protein
MSKNYETTAERIDYCRNEIGPPKAHRLPQQGDLDLEFSGWKVGDSEEVVRDDRSSVGVTMYFTTKGFLVAQVTRHLPSNRGPQYPHVKKSKAQAFSSWKEMLTWLKEDGRGWLGENSKIAWEETCTKLPWLHGEGTIRV